MTESPLCWMSFVDPSRSAPPEEQQPGTGGFLGVAIVQADSLEDAMTLSHVTGINPGGEVGIAGPIPAHMIAAEWRGWLLTAAEAEGIPEPNEEQRLAVQVLAADLRFERIVRAAVWARRIDSFPYRPSAP